MSDTAQKNIEKDLQRVKEFYQDNQTTSIETLQDLNYYYYSFAEHITDLSEDFVRECFKYDAMYEFRFQVLCKNQTKLSDKFYEDFLDRFDNTCKVYLIQYKRVSEEFLRNHIKDFPPEVWKQVYQNV